MFAIVFRKVGIVGLTVLMIIMAACSSPVAEVAPTAVPPTDIPPTTAPATSEGLLDAIKADDVLAVQRILEAGVDPNVEVDDVNPVFMAVARGNVAVVEQILVHGGDVMMETAVGTNLIDAATAGAELTEEQLQLAQFLLEQMVAQGWDVNQQDSTGSTYVGKVIYRGQYPIAEMLLEAGASLDIPNTSDETNLMAFARVGWVEQVRFLVTHGANLDYQGIWGISALHYAVDDNVYQEPGTPIEIVKILLEAGATPDLQNDLGETPLDIAVLKGHDELAQLLQEAVARAGD